MATNDARFAASLVAESPDALIAVSLDGTILFWNRGAESMFGFAADEAVGRTVESLIVPSDLRGEARAKLAQARAEGSLVFETTRMRKDGSFLVVDVTKRVVKNEAGEPDFIAVNKKDVTPLRKERAADTRFRGVLEAAPDAIVMADATGQITTVNTQVETLFGYTRDELVGQSIELLIPARHRSRHPGLREFYFAAPSVRPMKGGTALVGLRKDGREVPVDISLSPIVLPEGVMVIAAIRDITDRRRIEEALREARAGLEQRVEERTRELSASVDALRASEARFQRLSAAGIVGIVVATREGAVLDANDAWLRLLGYTRADLPHVHWPDLSPPEQAPVLAEAVDELITFGAARPRETELFHRDGTRVPVLYGAARLEHDQFIVFVADLSERQKAERALQHSEAQLRQAQKMDAIGRLAGGVAHDFNNILSVILSYSDLIVADLKAGDPLRDDIEEIRRAGTRAADLTRQLLLFSRQQVIEPRVLDLNDVLGSMDKMLQRILGADVDLVFRPTRPLGRVRADLSGMEQVIMNLVVNARDAMPAGGKLTMETDNVVLDEAYASTHIGTRPGRHVMLAVTDTGVGMDAPTLTRIFEPFFTTKEKGKGTGLGLSTVFGIVQQSGGSVWVYSEPGRGTTFKIYLPTVDAEVAHPASIPPPSTLRGSETILLVEDDDQVRSIALNILRKYGYEVIEARNAGEALLFVERVGRSIDLLLSDVVMPQMSGPELGRRLASIRPELKVLYMSGYTDDTIVRHGILEAPLAFLQKPITPDSLATKVREVLDTPARKH